MSEIEGGDGVLVEVTLPRGVWRRLVGFAGSAASAVSRCNQWCDTILETELAWAARYEMAVPGSRRQGTVLPPSYVVGLSRGAWWPQLVTAAGGEREASRMLGSWLTDWILDPIHDRSVASAERRGRLPGVPRPEIRQLNANVEVENYRETANACLGVARADEIREVIDGAVVHAARVVDDVDDVSSIMIELGLYLAPHGLELQPTGSGCAMRVVLDVDGEPAMLSASHFGEGYSGPQLVTRVRTLMP